MIDYEFYGNLNDCYYSLIVFYFDAMFIS